VQTFILEPVVKPFVPSWRRK